MLYYVTNSERIFQVNGGLHKLYGTAEGALKDSEPGWYVHAVNVTTYPVITGGLTLGESLDRDY